MYKILQSVCALMEVFDKYQEENEILLFCFLITFARLGFEWWNFFRSEQYIKNIIFPYIFKNKKYTKFGGRASDKEITKLSDLMKR